MIDRLATLHTIVDDQPVALVESLFSGNLPGSQHQMSQQVTVRILGLLYHRDSLPRDDQEVDRSLRSHIVECDTLIILMDEGGRDGTVQDLVEDCLLPRHSSTGRMAAIVLCTGHCWPHEGSHCSPTHRQHGATETEEGDPCVILYCTVLYLTVLYCTVLYCSVL